MTGMESGKPTGGLRHPVGFTLGSDPDQRFLICDQTLLRICSVTASGMGT
jgi:hypothetical protein